MTITRLYRDQITHAVLPVEDERAADAVRSAFPTDDPAVLRALAALDSPSRLESAEAETFLQLERVDLWWEVLGCGEDGVWEPLASGRTTIPDDAESILGRFQRSYPAYAGLMVEVYAFDAAGEAVVYSSAAM